MNTVSHIAITVPPVVTAPYLLFREVLHLRLIQRIHCIMSCLSCGVGHKRIAEQITQHPPKQTHNGLPSVLSWNSGIMRTTQTEHFSLLFTEFSNLFVRSTLRNASHIDLHPICTNEQRVSVYFRPMGWHLHGIIRIWIQDRGWFIPTEFRKQGREVAAHCCSGTASGCGLLDFSTGVVSAVSSIAISVSCSTGASLKRKRSHSATKFYDARDAE